MNQQEARQTLLFSATFPYASRPRAAKLMREPRLLGTDGAAHHGDDDLGGGGEAAAARRAPAASAAQRYAAAPPPETCLLYTSPSPRDRQKSRMPSSA